MAKRKKLVAIGKFSCVCRERKLPKKSLMSDQALGLVPLILDGAQCYDEVKERLEQGALVGETDAWGDTPLHAAAVKGRLIIVELLLQHGADPNVKNLSGSTPLHKAVVGGFRMVAQKLKDAGAELDQPNNGGFRPEYFTLDPSFKKQVSNEPVQEHMHSELIPERLIGTIIGKGGRKINEIRANSGLVDLKLQKNGKLTYFGTTPSVERAKANIARLSQSTNSVSAVCLTHIHTHTHTHTHTHNKLTDLSRRRAKSKEIQFGRTNTAY